MIRQIIRAGLGAALRALEEASAQAAQRPPTAAPLPGPPDRGHFDRAGSVRGKGLSQQGLTLLPGARSTAVASAQQVREGTHADTASMREQLQRSHLHRAHPARSAAHRDQAVAISGRILGRLDVWQCAHPDASVREAAREEHRQLSEMSLAVAASGSPDPASLHMSKLFTRMTDLQTEFDKNASRAVEVVLSPAHLAGVPEELLKQCGAQPVGQSMRLRFETPAQELAFLRTSHSGEGREKVWRALGARAPENVEVLRSLASTKHELKTLWGASSYAAACLQGSMMPTVDAAQKLIDSLGRTSTEEGRAALLDLKRQREPTASRVHPWEVPALNVVLRSAAGHRELASYLPVEATTMALFQHLGATLGLEIRPAPAEEAWHPDVRTWEVSRNGELLGLIDHDLLARPGKVDRDFAISLGEVARGVRRSALVNNLKPLELDGGLFYDPLALPDVAHEALHTLEALVSSHGPNGFKASLDFVEIPSVFGQRWAERPEVLSALANTATGKAIPPELLCRWDRYVRIARAECRQGLAVAAQVVLDVNTAGPDLDLDSIWKKANARHGSPVLEAERPGYLHFSDIAGPTLVYLSYPLGESLADPCLARFKAGDPLDGEMGAHYRQTVLEGPGNASERLERFLQLPPAPATNSVEWR